MVRAAVLALAPSDGAGLDPGTLVVALGLLVVAVVVAARRQTRRRPARRGTAPRVGDVWWAQVPYEDGTGSKDRPCVVVEAHRFGVVVLYVTSTDRSGRAGWLAMPRQGWSSGGGTSWLRTDRRITLSPRALRRYAGPAPTSVRKALRL